MGAAAAVPAGMAVAGGLFSAYEQGEAGKAQGSYYDYLAGGARLNAGLAEAEGKAKVNEISAQAGQHEQLLARRIATTVGSEKAALAAGGAGLSSRTAQDIVSDTLTKGNLDEMALRYNAEIASKNAVLGAKVQTMNYETQAEGYGMAGRNARSAAKIAQFSTLLGTASSVSSAWYKTNPPAVNNYYGGYSYA